MHAADRPDAAWWRDAVIYQVYPRSFADADGDGIGDLPGITARLPHLRDLGVDAVWLSPFYTLAAGRRRLRRRRLPRRRPAVRHPRRLRRDARRAPTASACKVIVDLVPNHTSDEHAWFQAALAAAPGQPGARALHVPRRHGRATASCRRTTGSPSSAARPGPASPSPTARPASGTCTCSTPRSPTSTGTTPRCAREFRGDPALLARPRRRRLPGRRRARPGQGAGPARLRRRPRRCSSGDGSTPERRRRRRRPMWDQDGVHEIYRALAQGARRVRRPTAILVRRGLGASRWSALARYVRPDEMHQAFNFDYLETPVGRRATCATVIDALARRRRRASARRRTWVLSNHDVVRHASRLGLTRRHRRPNGIGADDPQPDRALGLRRARAATAADAGAARLAPTSTRARSSACPTSPTCPDEVRQDPTFAPHRRRRDAAATAAACRCRGRRTRPSFGFGPSDADLAAAARRSTADYAVDQQDGRGRLDARALPRPARRAPRASPRDRLAARGSRGMPATSSR